ncbi:hypothetical protein K1719_033049 [Acacia pycnantha]|nr:hypothetical protein K1719_033049 [Acacia pycnantha]
MALILSKKKGALVPSFAKDEDLLLRSSKKMKNDDAMRQDEEWPMLGNNGKKAWVGGQSFAEKLQGIKCKGNKKDETVENNADSDDSMSEDGSKDVDDIWPLFGVGRSGGLVAVWKKSEIDVMVGSSGRQFMHFKCDRRSGLKFAFSMVYALPDASHKQVLWDELHRHASTLSEPWVLIGDFNDVLLASERAGSSRPDEARLRLFNDRVRSCQLEDLGKGPKARVKSLIREVRSCYGQ